MEKSAASILESLDAKLLENLCSVSERYYEHKYCMKVDGVHGDIHQRLCFHSNRVVMLSLADHHPVIKQSKSIQRVRWQVDDQTDRSKNAASGKRKKGAQKLRADSVVCRVECMDGSSYPVYSCVPGAKLLEVNSEQLDADPSLLVRRPVSAGYIALVLPYLHLYDPFKDSLLTPQQYDDLHITSYRKQ